MIKQNSQSSFDHNNVFIPSEQQFYYSKENVLSQNNIFDSENNIFKRSLSIEENSQLDNCNNLDSLYNTENPKITLSPKFSSKSNSQLSENQNPHFAELQYDISIFASINSQKNGIQLFDDLNDSSALNSHFSLSENQQNDNLAQGTQSMQCFSLISQENSQIANYKQIQNCEENVSFQENNFVFGFLKNYDENEQNPPIFQFNNQINLHQNQIISHIQNVSCISQNNYDISNYHLSQTQNQNESLTSHQNLDMLIIPENAQQRLENSDTLNSNIHQIENNQSYHDTESVQTDQSSLLIFPESSRKSHSQRIIDQHQNQMQNFTNLDESQKRVTKKYRNHGKSKPKQKNLNITQKKHVFDQLDKGTPQRLCTLCKIYCKDFQMIGKRSHFSLFINLLVYHINYQRTGTFDEEQQKIYGKYQPNDAFKRILNTYMQLNQEFITQLKYELTHCKKKISKVYENSSIHKAVVRIHKALNKL